MAIAYEKDEHSLVIAVQVKIRTLLIVGANGHSPLQNFSVLIFLRNAIVITDDIMLNVRFLVKVEYVTQAAW